MKHLHAALASILFAFSVQAAELSTVEEIDACIEGNRPERSSIQTIRIDVVDRVGNENAMDAKIYWAKGDKGSQVLATWDEPPDLRGAAVLMLEQDGGRNDMFMYLPELGKTRRINQHMMSGSMLGMDFSYEDFERLQRMAEDQSSKREENSEVEGRPVYVITRMPGGDSEYERIVTSVDQETCVPLRTEFYERGDELRKLMTTKFEDISKETAGWVPKRMRMQDLIEGTETRIVVEEMEFEVDIPRKYFSQAQLERMGR